ncbi:MAG: hypothetical protein ACW99A_16060 [Candidatus Kariarchaeaceae archaeon]|jgi:hypothetical protein
MENVGIVKQLFPIGRPSSSIVYRIPLHPNHKHLIIYSYCDGKKEWIPKESNSDETKTQVLWKGCGKRNDAICILDEELILKGIEILSPTDERMKYAQ